MHSDSSLDRTEEQPPGLPVIVPPSGRLIAQLFFVPMIIVASVVGLLLLVNWLVGSSRSPADYLKKLDSSNADVRWRAAEDLAQTLLRDDRLASDPAFALDLAERLKQALENIASVETTPKKVPLAPTASPGEADLNLDPESDYALYLAASLGNFTIPAGAPILCQMAEPNAGRTSALGGRTRWRALWILANLGENLKRFEKLAQERQQSVIESLEREAAASGERGAWANAALHYLQGPDAGSVNTLGVEKALAQSAVDGNPFLRTMAAFALNFWEGTESENKRLEELLVKLSRDDGHGEVELAKLREAEGQPEETIIRTPGLKIRYNATIAVARRGSNKTRFDVLAEMLDEGALRKNFRLKLADGREVPDESTVSLTVVTALKAISEFHRRNPDRDLSVLAGPLDTLARDSSIALRSEAERTRFALRK
jgi:hypothetical protein